MRLRPLLAATTAAAALAGCGGTSTPSSAPTLRTPPSFAAFLREPVATPSVCPSSNGQSDGRKSPWVGHVDVSVFLKTSASPAAVTRMGTSLRNSPLVEHVYFESRDQAYAEFQRLYECWAEVPRSQTPASYRLVLRTTTSIIQRNSLVARVLRDPSVDSVSCDPSLPCVDVVRSAQPR